MLWLNSWNFCRNVGCLNRASLPGLRDRFSARQWLQQFQGDYSKILSMRTILLAETWGAEDLSRSSDQAVITAIADLLVSGRIHVHELPLQDAPPSRAPSYSVSAKQSVPPAVPKKGQSSYGSAPQAPVDAPTFSPALDASAQAATLTAAAAGGKPFCPE